MKDLAFYICGVATGLGLGSWICELIYCRSPTRAADALKRATAWAEYQAKIKKTKP
jgi:hypothetical protein